MGKTRSTHGDLIFHIVHSNQSMALTIHFQHLSCDMNHFCFDSRKSWRTTDGKNTEAKKISFIINNLKILIVKF
jgi:hypothetical protein